MKVGQESVSKWISAVFLGVFAYGASWSSFAQDASGNPSSSDSSGSDSSSGGGLLSHIDFSIGGFIRPEASWGTGYENPYNEGGNPYNNENVQRTAHVPPHTAGTATGLEVGSWSGNPGFPGYGTNPLVLGQDTVKRPIDNSNNFFNFHVLRAETEMGIKFGDDFKLIARLRAIGDPGHYSDFNGASVDGMDGGISGGRSSLYGGAPNLFQYEVDGRKHPNPLEWSGPNYMVYFPALVLDYSAGPINVRVGNQSIAWGQAIFFRVLDVVDGLDLRRHSVLDYAQEEFSDKRTPSLGIRVGYQVTDSILLDSFVQKFQPTVYGNPGTPYNVIPVQFTVHDLYHENGDDQWNKLNYGIRMKANFGQFGLQAIAVRRYNPDGVFRWTQSGVVKALPTTNVIGSTVDTAAPVLTGMNEGTILSKTPFEASPGGVYSANEWFHYAGLVRLDGIKGLNAAINEFQPYTGDTYASPVTSYKDAVAELNTFFAAGDGLRGHIAREYFQENVFGLGASYVTEAEPGSFFDQIIFNLETSYTPDRTFTATTLSHDYPREPNSVSALVIEKYQRFSVYFPATYFVLQYMHRSKDDLFGRLLTGYGASDNYDGNASQADPGIKGGANYVVFAFQQPFPQDIYRIGFATLYDPRGGILVQPGIQYRPSSRWSFDAFYSYINGHFAGNPNNNVLSTADFADELTLRVGYQF